MMRGWRSPWLLAAVALACGSGDRASTLRGARVDALPGLEILALPEGYALVQDRREVEIATHAGSPSELRLEGVPRLLRESTVTLRSFTDPDGLRVLSQRFDFDARDAAQALDRHVGNDVVVVTDAGEVRGRLVAHDAAAITVDTGAGGGGVDRYRVVPLGESLHSIRLGDHSGGWLVTPRLVWELEARHGGKHLVEIVYETAGVRWSADHTVVLGDGAPLVSSWATVVNQSGTTFEAASLELVEADGALGGQYYGAYGGDLYGGLGVVDSGYLDVRGPFAELTGVPPVPQRRNPDADYRVYGVAEPVTLVEGAATQIALPSGGARTGWIEHRLELVPETWISKDFRRDPSYGSLTPKQSAAREIVIERSETAPALPAGNVRVFRERDEPVLVAQARSTRVDAGKPIRIPVEGSPDVTGHRVRRSLFQDPRAHKLKERIAITVENRGAQEARVRVVEHMIRGERWEITDSSVAREEVGKRTVAFPVTVGPGKRVSVTYLVVYSW